MSFIKHSDGEIAKVIKAEEQVEEMDNFQKNKQKNQELSPEPLENLEEKLD